MVPYGRGLHRASLLDVSLLLQDMSFGALSTLTKVVLAPGAGLAWMTSAWTAAAVDAAGVAGTSTRQAFSRLAATPTAAGGGVLDSALASPCR